MDRLAMFVDGWNFYWSLVNADMKPYGWCNFAQLAQQQTGLPNATVNVKYFTSEDKPNPEKIFDRQRPTWWRALSYLGVQIVGRQSYHWHCIPTMSHWGQFNRLWTGDIPRLAEPDREHFGSRILRCPAAPWQSVVVAQNHASTHETPGPMKLVGV